MSDASGITAWSYDPVGHIVTERRTIGTVTDNTSYTYNVDGSTASVTYPSGRIVAYTYNNAQQAVSVVDSTSSTNYVTGATYAPHGQLASAVRGHVNGGFAGITETYTYNNRLQVVTHQATSSGGTALDHAYSYDLGGGVNNGNIASITNNVNTGRSQSFTYDNLNRMATAQSQATTGTDCWGNSYGYDRYGNLLTMAVTKCTAQSLNVTVNNNNQIVGFTYDAAGNLLSDGSKAYTWDAENRPKTAAGTAYTFDGTNARVKKGTNDLYWFSAASCKHPLFGRSTSAGVYTDEFVHFNGQPVGYRDDTAGAVYHLVTDEAGSVRAMTNSSGVKQFESDYYPQGGQRVITATKDSLLKFQAKQLDTESGLENAARLYNPATARFLSVAARPASKTHNPQALNKVSATAATPLNSFTSSVGSILSSFQSSFSSYRQCAQTVWDLGFVFTDGIQVDDGWVELICGIPEPIVLFTAGEIIYKDGVPPATGELLNKLICVAECLGTSIFVTATSNDHPPNDPHTRGVAADLRYRLPDQTLCCAGKCGFGSGKDEKKHPSKNATGPHIHLQIPRGPNGGRGDIPANCHP
jgi:YD repeat-containing protein